MDPLQNQIPPVPESPASIPAAQNEPELSQEQMKANLSELMGKIDRKYQDFNSHKFSSDNKLNQTNGEYLSQVFDLLQQNGVDPSNIEEVRAFLEKVEDKDPELAKTLKDALQIILGEEEGNVSEDGEVALPKNLADSVSQENMNTNISSDETIPPNL